MAIIGMVVSAALIAQYIIGSDQSIVSGRVETLNTLRREFSSVTRILVPGSSIVIFGLITFIVIHLLKAVRGKGRIFILPAIVLLAFGLLLTFTRVYWIMVLVAVLLFMVLAHRRSLIYPRLAMLGLGVGLGIVLILQAKVLDSSVISDAIVQRTRSILSASSRFKEDTLFIRYLESRYAWEKITEHPWLGIGLGNSYRSKIFNNDNISNVQGVSVHNGYLATQLKMGLPGTLAYFWLIIVFFKRALKYWYRVKTPLYQAIVLGITLSIIGMFVHSLVASPFMAVYWVATFAVAIGIIEKIYQFEGLT
jgi:O-antigen ligase